MSSEDRGVNFGVHSTRVRGVPCVLITNSGSVRGNAISIHSEGRNRRNTVDISRFTSVVRGRVGSGTLWSMVSWVVGGGPR